MKKQAYEIIMRYFNTEHIDRVELEKSLDFENLTMTEQIETDIKKQLVDAGYSKKEAQNSIREFIRFVKDRSGSGEITWEDFINKLKDLEDWFAESDFGIRVQRFSKETYWEAFFILMRFLKNRNYLFSARWGKNGLTLKKSTQKKLY